MAKKLTAPAPPEPAAEVYATVPTPLHPEDLMCPAGYVQVKESDYHQLIETAKKLISQKKELSEKNDEYKEDLSTIVKSLVALGPLVGQGGFSPASIMKLMQNKDKLAESLKPMFEVLEKYTTPAPAQLTA